MQNTITTSIPGILVAAGKANTALSLYKEQIGLVHNSSELVLDEMADLITSCGNYDAGRDELAKRKEALRSLAAKARALAMLAREILKPHLGSQYSEAWDATGYRGSLTTPTSPDDLQGMMVTMKGWYAAHPEREVAPLNITAADTNSLYEDMVAANSNISLQEKTVDELLTFRNQKADALRRRLRLVIDELDMKLNPLDPLWLAFGFNKPGADATPDTPEHLRVTLNGTSATLTWATAPRAEHYRVWKKVAGVDVEPVAIASPTDLLSVVNDLPANATVEFAVSAVNNGGESARSEAITLVTH